jgi:hypothetical protein
VDGFRPDQWPRFVRFPTFSRDWDRLGFDDAALRNLELEILRDPTRAPVISGTGGLRKLRIADPKSGRGKSGAFRVCYADFPEFGTVALIVIFGKNEKHNLTKADCNAIAAVIRAYREELRRESLQGRNPEQP